MKRKLVLTAMLFIFGPLVFAEDLRLEPTQNVYTFLKLDTRAGQIWQVQWGDKDHKFVQPINLKSLVSDGEAGRFTLYPTSNIYTFILLDQQTGGVWHVQWGRPEDRFMVPIE